jgi:hypothetical protein
MPDHMSTNLYGLLAYTLPTDWFSGVQITPLFMMEYAHHRDFEPNAKVIVIRGGINVKPWPSLAIKFTYSNARLPDSELVQSALHLISGQVALAF